MSRPWNVAFLHPALIIGGAERLVVDAALSLQKLGHRVVVFTARYDPENCFADARQLDVRVVGRALPTDIFGHLRAPCAIARCGLAARSLGQVGNWDLVFCDVVPHVVPLLRRVSLAPVIFYCHFPDLLLTPERRPAFDLYRWPLDRWEGFGLAKADLLLTNSTFTAAMVRKIFPSHQLEPRVLYPGVDCARSPQPHALEGEIQILSLSRFSRQKNVVLAIEALAAMRLRVPADLFERVRLVLAGGYDAKQSQQTELIEALRQRSRDLNLEGKVEIIPSVSDAEKIRLLDACRCVVYTPKDEHFGLVPLEAMAAARAVIAPNSGGPRETIVNGVNGYLRDPAPDAFADSMANLVTNPDLAERMGRAARSHVVENFSLAAFANKLEIEIRDVIAANATSVSR